MLRKTISRRNSLTLTSSSSVVSTGCYSYLLGVAIVATFVLYHTYTYVLWRYDLVNQAVTAALFAGVGDVLAQTATGRPETRKPYDARRTVQFVLKGFGGGIMWNAWYHLSDPLSLSLAHRLLGSTVIDDASTTRTNAVKAMATATIVDPMVLLQAVRVGICIVLEQCLVSPLFYSLWDIPVPALLSGVSARHIPAHISTKLGPLLLANAKIWTPSNLITYNLPTEYRVLFASCIDVLWQVVCSKITSCEADLVTLPTAAAAVAATSLSMVGDEDDGDNNNGVPIVRSSSESARMNSSSSCRSPTRFLSSARALSISTQMESGKGNISPTHDKSSAPSFHSELYHGGIDIPV